MGYSLFRVYGAVDDAERLPPLLDVDCVKSYVKLVDHYPFTTDSAQLEHCKYISKAIVSDELRLFLQLNLPPWKMWNWSYTLGVCDQKLAEEIQKETQIPCVVHSLDINERNIRLLSLNLRKLYSPHFPELDGIVKDNYSYAKIVKCIGNKSQPSLGDSTALNVIAHPDLVKLITDSANSSIDASCSARGKKLYAEMLGKLHLTEKKMEEKRKLIEQWNSFMNYGIERRTGASSSEEDSSDSSSGSDSPSA
ncbi:nucleolar protein 56-like [Miscanthus floridulus]|uniref:nucleolar protein 56-like n=1 Tax=Miscanthus floridulus TaxID=154761 RepID=UPI00345ACB55